MSDQQFRIATIAGAVALVMVMTYVRFCGSVSLPAKPPPPTGPTGTQTQLLTKSTASAGVYNRFLETDAAAAGVRAPSVGDMAKKFPYRVDDGRHVLEPGKPPIELAGLKIWLERTGDKVIMAIANQLDSDIAYSVTSTPSVGAGACSSVAAMAHKAMVIGKGGSERRTECAWRDGMSIQRAEVEVDKDEPLKLELAAFIASVAQGKDPAVTGQQGTAALELALEITRRIHEQG